MTYGRSIAKASNKFDLHRSAWPSLAADRAGWREMLRFAMMYARREIINEICFEI